MHTREKGDLGESIACTFLQQAGFKIAARNYRKKWGEIDIVARKGSELHFVEVKSITVKRSGSWALAQHRPEENVHEWKMRKIARTIRTYLMEFNHPPDAAFRFHVLCVYMDMETRKARVKWIQNVIL